MINADILVSQYQSTQREFSKVPDVLSGLIGELPSDRLAINNVVSAPIKIGISIFRDVFGKERETHQVTWDGVDELLSDSCVYTCKSACRLLKLAVFGDKRTDKGSLRSDENILEIYGIEGDYDAGQVSLTEAAAKLEEQGVEACFYTTPSHTPERPRWRVLVPLSKGHSPSERAKFVAVIDDMLGNILAKESYTVSQTFYFGKVKGATYETYRVHGKPVDKLDPEIINRYSSKCIEDIAKTEPQTDGLNRQCTLHAVTEETIADLRSALLGMKPERADDRALWINVLEALASLKETSYCEVAFDLAHEFSKKCEAKYDPEYLNSTWESMAPSQITYRSIFKWAQEDGRSNPGCKVSESRIDRTDAGNMALLAKITDGNLRYVPEHNMWLWWDGTRWESDRYGTASQERALKVGEHYHVKAAELRARMQEGAFDTKEGNNIGKAIESLEKWATQCRNKRAIDSMLNLAKSDKRFTLPASKLDCDPFLFGVKNGVVDLGTGALREASRDEYVTRRSPLRFNPNAKAPRWNQFIKEVTAFPNSESLCGYIVRPELANYLQRALGYTMTGSTAEQKMFIAIGAGSNGKNILLDTLQCVMGEYCQTIPPEALMATRYSIDAERPSPTTAMLAGARTAIGSESKDGQKLDVVLVKRHTGGGYMTARHMRENTFRFKITHKLWLMTNHKPKLDHIDEALRGRLHLLPFDMRWNRPGHPERDPLLPDGDKNLLEELIEEGEGILAWLIAGTVDYMNNGLEPPKEVLRITRSYFMENDLVGRWMEDVCKKCDIKLGERASELFLSFQIWCQEEGISDIAPNNQTAFSNELVKRGIDKHKLKNGMYYGLQIIGALKE